MEVEENVLAILRGEAVSIENKVDIASEKDMKFVPVTKGSMCYICCSVLFNDEGHILMMQEAKRSCHGSWYLPAGRLEPAETLIDGAKREVKEETGVECDLTSLISVEIIGGTWMRFTFIGKITGGKLKTTEEKDAESLQAQYFPFDKLPTPLRSNDIFKLIKLAQKCQGLESGTSPITQPVITPHHHVVHRLIIMDNPPDGDNPVKILISREHGEPHIPTVIGCSKAYHLDFFASCVLHVACSSKSFEHKFIKHGIIGVEHRGTGKKEDGICITYLVSLDLDQLESAPVTKSANFTWHTLSNGQIHKQLRDCTEGNLIHIL